MKIEFENVSKVYGQEEVLKDINVTIDEDYSAIIGPDGAGKSTLLRLITGVEDPTEGTIYFDGEDVSDVPPQERDVAMIFQTFALYPNMTLYDNIASPLDALGVDDDEKDRIVREQAEMLGLEDLLDHNTTELSGGEKQRAALARALAKDSEVYLLDEPFTNLDYKLREDLRVEVKRVMEEKGASVILASPDADEVMTFSDWAMFMYGGEIKQTGPTEEVFRNPGTVEVGRHFSKPPMNLLDATLEEEDGNALHFGKDTTVKVTHLDVPEYHGDYIVGIRPHDIKTEKDEGDVEMSAEVLLEEKAGSETLVRVQIGDQRAVMYKPYLTDYGRGNLDIYVSPKKLYVYRTDNRELVETLEEAL